MSTKKSYYAQIVALALVMLLLVACGGPAVALTPVPPIATPVPPTATPSVGTVTGVLTGAKSQKTIANASVLLCTIVDPAAVDPECRLRASLIAITGTDGKFEFPSVSPGSYVVVYGLSDAARQTWDGLSVRFRGKVMDNTGKKDPFGDKGRSRADGKMNIAGDGIYMNTGYVASDQYELTLEYREGKPPTIAVTAGQTGSIMLEATTQ